MSWTDPPQMDKLEELLHEVSKLSSRGQVVAIAAITLSALLEMEKRPEFDVSYDIVINVLGACVNVAEMDVCKFLSTKFRGAEKEGIEVTGEVVADTLSMFAQMMQKKALEHTETVRKLVALLDMKKSEDAGQ